MAREDANASGGGTNTVSPVTLQQQNMAARSIVVGSSLNMTQQIFSTTITTPTSGNNVININPRLVGMLKRFYVVVTGTLTNTDANNGSTMTELGLSNLLSNVTFTDLANNVRINTSGWHLHMLACVKRGSVHGAAYTHDLSSFINTGASWATINAASASLTKAGGATPTSTFRMIYEIPITYSDTDLRGAIWLGVTNATANLQLTINPTPFVASGDPTLAVQTGGTGTLNNVSVVVYQNYLDQVPTNKGAPILPLTDLSTTYLLNNTTAVAGGIVANSDTPVPYANFRDFLSTFAIFDNYVAGTPNYIGTDVNYFALQAANYVNFWKMEPQLCALLTRQRLGNDMPKSVYYFDHRAKPISTIQYGNIELVLNAKTVNSGAALLMGYEQFALINTISQAGSLTTA